MKGTLDDLYLIWLYEQIGSIKVVNPARTHWRLIRQLYTTEFAWSIPHDDNREADGKILRWEFLEDHGIEDPDPEWMDLGCSMLEMLIALARRISFQADGPVFAWFWEIVENTGIDARGHCDLYYNEDSAKNINVALERVVSRTYDFDGQGGLFPLPGTTIDQREVEIWYQMHAYLMSDL